MSIFTESEISELRRRVTALEKQTKEPTGINPAEWKELLAAVGSNFEPAHLQRLEDHPCSVWPLLYLIRDLQAQIEFLRKGPKSP